MREIETVRDPTWSHEKVALLGSSHSILHKYYLSSHTDDLDSVVSQFRLDYDPHAMSKNMRAKYASIPKLASNVLLPFRRRAVQHVVEPIHSVVFVVQVGVVLDSVRKPDTI